MLALGEADAAMASPTPRMRGSKTGARCALKLFLDVVSSVPTLQSWPTAASFAAVLQFTVAFFACYSTLLAYSRNIVNLSEGGVERRYEA